MTNTPPQFPDYGRVPNSNDSAPLTRYEVQRSPAPGLGLIITITLLFGLFGLIPTVLRARQAIQRGLSILPYWVAFGVSFVVSMVIWGLLWAVLIIVGVSNADSAQETKLENSIVNSTENNPTGLGNPTKADCDARGNVPENGNGVYDCTITFGSNGTRDYVVTVTGDRWSAVPRN